MRRTERHSKFRVENKHNEPVDANADPIGFNEKGTVLLLFIYPSA